MFIEQLLFITIAFGIFVCMFYKLIKTNDTKYVPILALEALGIGIKFIEVCFGKEINIFTGLITYTLSILLPIGIICIEKTNGNIAENFYIVLAKIYSSNVDMVDVNLRALHLAKRNAKLNGVLEKVCVFESNCYQNITSKYSTIVTNPPIRAGKKIVYEMVMNAKDHLEDGGNLFLVICKEQGAKSLLADLEKVYQVKVLEKKKGFFIIQCHL